MESNLVWVVAHEFPLHSAPYDRSHRYVFYDEKNNIPAYGNDIYRSEKGAVVKDGDVFRRLNTFPTREAALEAQPATNPSGLYFEVRNINLGKLPLARR